MNHFFDDKRARDIFKTLIAKLDEEHKSLFRIAIKDAWEAKQFSERDDLPTFRLTEQEVADIYQKVY